MSKLEVWKQVWIFDSTVAFYCPCRWPRIWQFLLFSSKCQLLSKLFPTSLNDMLMSSVRAQIIIRFCNWDNGSRPVRKSNFGPWCWMGEELLMGNDTLLLISWQHEIIFIRYGKTIILDGIQIFHQFFSLITKCFFLYIKLKS